MVEDAKLNQKVVARHLSKFGVKAEVANNGKEAIEMLSPAGAAARFAFILMDLEMDIVNGHEATQRLRQLGIKTPIIALSGSCLDEDRDQCVRDGESYNRVLSCTHRGLLLAGMNGFLSKPLVVKDLEDVIRRFATQPPSSASEPSPLSQASTSTTASASASASSAAPSGSVSVTIAGSGS